MLSLPAQWMDQLGAEDRIERTLEHCRINEQRAVGGP